MIDITSQLSAAYANGRLSLSGDSVSTSAITLSAGFHLELNGFTLKSPGIAIVPGTSNEPCIIRNGRLRGTGMGTGIAVLTPRFRLENVYMGDPAFDTFGPGLAYDFDDALLIDYAAGSGGHIHGCTFYGYRHRGITMQGAGDIVMDSCDIMSAKLLENGAWNLPKWGLHMASTSVVTACHVWGPHEYTGFIDGDACEITSCQFEGGYTAALVVCGSHNRISGGACFLRGNDLATECPNAVGIMLGQAPFDGIGASGGWASYNMFGAIVLGEPGDTGRGFPSSYFVYSSVQKQNIGTVILAGAAPLNGAPACTNPPPWSDDSINFPVLGK